MAKSLIRATSRPGSHSDKRPPVAHREKPSPEPAVCEHCGATFVRQTWRTGRPLTASFLDGATWTVCPACKQVERGEYYGRVVISGAFAAASAEAIRRRIANIDARARVTQPEWRVSAANRAGRVLEVLTTSQKLAHRIVHELKKAFRGRASYQWSDEDGSLFATWHRD
jgi:hypothetical protein